MADIKLYWAPRTCAMAPHIVLEWAGADYDAERVKPGSDEYKRINPLGAVPAMVDGDSGVMTQADAILKYLAEKFPDASLGPADDPRARYEMNRWLAYLTGDLHPAFFPFFNPQRYTTSSDDDALGAVKDAAIARIGVVLAVLEDHVAGDHIVEGRRTIVDPYAFAMLRWVNLLPDKLSAYPSLQAFYNAFVTDHGVQKVLGIHGVKA